MTSQNLNFVRRGLAISLMATSALASAQLSYAAPTRVAQANTYQSNSNQPDLKAMIERASTLQTKGDFETAASTWKQILAILEKALGPDHPNVATGLNNLALLLKDQGQYAAAEPLFRRAQAINEKTLGPDHPNVASGLNSLAVLLKDQGQYAAAENSSAALRQFTKKPSDQIIPMSLPALTTWRYF